MGLIVDNFAGGGGASTGIEAALGRAVDIAINHDAEAIRMHEANHPGTRHIRNNIWQVDPREVCAPTSSSEAVGPSGYVPVDLAWFSPDCKHFSKAKGGKPREKGIRDLAWVVVLWAQRVRPKLILLENVEEFRTWGPLCERGYPIKERQGETFDKWQRELRKLGYKLQFRELRACDYGAPTIRKRFFMVARCDGQPIVWPEPTHAPADADERAKWLARQRKAGFKVPRPDTLKPWRSAAEIIDWTIPCPSIFERKKPLAEKTLRRIAHGIVKFVIDNPRPFIVGTAFNNTRACRVFDPDEPLRTQTAQAEYAVVSPHITKFRAGAVGHDAGEPLHTVTANSYVKRPGGAAPLGVVGATLISTRNGEREGQEPRARDVEDPHATVTAVGSQGAMVAAFMQKFADNGKGVDPEEPLHTVMAGAPRHSVVCAHLEQANGSPEGEKPLPGRSAGDPLATIVAKGCTQRLVTSNLIKLRGTSRDGQPVDEPLHTLSAQGTHMAEVRAFLIKYYGGVSSDEGHGLDNPIGTVTVQDRFGVVTVTIAGEEYVIVDIGMRMLTPRELFNAQGFPPDYTIDRDAEGRPMTKKTAQVAKCGNSVCPPLAEALAGANWREGEESAVAGSAAA